MAEVTREQIVKRLQEQITLYGSQKMAAFKLDITAQHLSDLINGYRQPGKKTLTALGLEAAKVYRTKEGCENG